MSADTGEARTGATGRIVRATGGFYYVETGEGVVECRARGIFRKDGVTPLCGDEVRISLQKATGMVEEILPRQNFLVRPPVANLDRLVVVASLADPSPDPFAVDKLLAIAEHKEIGAVVVFTKNDLCHDDTLPAIYRGAGYDAFSVCSKTGDGIAQVRQALRGLVCAFAGNSGVGKSSLLNAVAPGLSLKVGEVSRKLGRGRHTTRTVELFPMEDTGGCLADTPGFSSLDIEQGQIIRRDDLQYAFREFAPYVGGCRFTGCAHVKESGCAVRAAVEEGKIAHSRYKSYCAMFEIVKDLKDWELKKQAPGDAAR